MSDLTVWRKAHDLIADGDWATGEPHFVDEVTSKPCYCAGGAIATALTGNAHRMYDRNSEVEDLLNRFADYVGASDLRTWSKTRTPAAACERVYDWNDNVATKEDVLKALQELHDIEVASTT